MSHMLRRQLIGRSGRETLCVCILLYGAWAMVPRAVLRTLGT